MRISPRKLLFVALTFGFYFVGGISQAYAAVTTNFPVFGTTLFTDTVTSPTSTLNFQVTTDNQSDLNLGVVQGEWGIQTKHVPGTQVFSSCYPYNLSAGETRDFTFDLTIGNYGSSYVVWFPTGECGNSSSRVVGAPLYANPNDEIFTVASLVPTTSTTSIATTTQVFDYTSHFNYFVLLFLSGWFLLLIYVVKSQTLKFL